MKIFLLLTTILISGLCTAQTSVNGLIENNNLTAVWIFGVCGGENSTTQCSPADGTFTISFPTTGTAQIWFSDCNGNQQTFYATSSDFITGFYCEPIPPPPPNDTFIVVVTADVSEFVASIEKERSHPNFDHVQDIYGNYLYGDPALWFSNWNYIAVRKQGKKFKFTTYLKP